MIFTQHENEKRKKEIRTTFAAILGPLTLIVGDEILGKGAGEQNNVRVETVHCIAMAMGYTITQFNSIVVLPNMGFHGTLVLTGCRTFIFF